MKKLMSLLIAVALIAGVAVSPVFAAGGKNQNEIGAPSAPGPGGDAQGNQA